VSHTVLVLLTITTTRPDGADWPATDLEYLLAKNPGRVQSFEHAFGRSRVFYPEAGEQRCIYGPEYLEPRNLARLRKRFLGRKQSLALREYALGLEALERLVAREPLYRVHESLFAVLALESEPVDPRL
jgi:hypothetical protein